MTVLFADLAGSTALGERLDPEDVRELQGELFDADQHRGRALRRHDREVRRRRGARRVRDSAGARGRRRARRSDCTGRPRRFRIIHRACARPPRRRGGAPDRRQHRRGRLGPRGGRTWRADGERGRRQRGGAPPAACPAGRGPRRARTQAATSRVVSYREREPLAAKGKSDPVRAWVAEAAAAEQEAPPRGMAGLTAPLVGRDEELAILTAVAGRVEREHTPQLVTLFGAAGVGKSRLLAELVDRLPDARVIRGRCLPYGEGITFWPLAEAAKAHARILDNDPADVALAKLRAAIESVVPEGQAERVVEAAAWTIGLGAVAGDRPARGGASPERGLGTLRRRPRPRAVHGLRRRGRALGLERPPRPAGAARRQPRRHAHPARLHGPARAAGEPPDLGSGQAERERPHAGSAHGRGGDRADLVAPRREPGSAGRPRASPGERRGQSVLPRGDADDADRGGRARAPKRRLELDARGSRTSRSRTRCTA